MVAKKKASEKLI
jgi:WD40 repeat protein